MSTNQSIDCSQRVHRGRKSHQTFVDDLNMRNTICDNQVFLVDGELYINDATKLMFLCSQNHKFYSKPSNIIKGQGCPTCKKCIVSTKLKKSHSQFLNDLVIRNSGVVDNKQQVFLLPGEIYSGTHNPLKFTCLQHHTWSTKPNYVLSIGTACPTCNTNKTHSNKSIIWLEYIQQLTNHHIMHKLNGGEFIIPNTRFRSDGFCKETNTVYEFYGDYWHGNPLKFNSDDINHSSNKSFGELYRNTMIREQKIKDLGYNIVSIWESEFDNINHPSSSEEI